MRIHLLAAGAALLLTTAAAEAGPISRACMTADRSGSAALCGCIQQVANRTLDRSDQRLAAKIFRKPQMAQDIKMSSNRSHEAFWEKYKVFGAAASQTCS